jgi:hypothetical protein
MLEYSLTDGPAFINLSSHATRILILLLRRFNGHNNGSIPLGAREAGQWCHCDHVTAWRALKELQKSNLITVVDKGRIVLDGSGINRATRWRLNFVRETKANAPTVSPMKHRTVSPMKHRKAPSFHP